VRERTAELQRFRSAMDATADAIFLLDAGSAELVDVNDGACRMLGYPRGEMLGPSASRSASARRPRAAGRTAGRYAAAVGRRAPELAELELMRRDLIAVPVELYWQLLQRPGQPSVLLGVARDISERRQAEELLQHMAHYDSLTGLPNRTLFFKALADAIALAQDKAGASRAVHRPGPLQEHQRYAGRRAATSCCASSATGWCSACACATRWAAWAATSSR
jgi:PAS domain S-box-containing protein